MRLKVETELVGLEILSNRLSQDVQPNLRRSFDIQFRRESWLKRSVRIYKWVVRVGEEENNPNDLPGAPQKTRMAHNRPP